MAKRDKKKPGSSGKWKTLLVTSGYGGNTRQPFVEIHSDKLKDEVLQLSPGEARDFAANLLQAAEAAEQDAFIFEFHSELLESPVRGAQMLSQFRVWRDAHGQNR